MEHKIGEFNLLNDAEFNCLLQKVKQEIKQFLIEFSGYSLPLKEITNNFKYSYPNWFVAFACQSLLADKQIIQHIQYHALESDWAADLEQWQDGKKLETNNFTLGDK
jgi:hypothetical protein